MKASDFRHAVGVHKVAFVAAQKQSRVALIDRRQSLGRFPYVVLCVNIGVHAACF